MRKITFFLSLLLSSNLWAQFKCSQKTSVNWEELSPGVAYAKYDLNFTQYFKEQKEWDKKLAGLVTVRAFKINLENNQLLFHSPEKDLTCTAGQRYIRNLIKDNGGEIIGAINANFFVMPNKNILGMAIDEKKVWSATSENLTISSSHVLSVQDGSPSLEKRTAFAEKYGSTLKPEIAQKFSFLVQGYPGLVNDGELAIGDGVKESRVSRTSIGVNEKEIYIVTINAKEGSISNGMSLFEYANFIQNSECGVAQKMALNLDGGGSTAFAIPGKDIYEQVDQCRHLGNILTIQKRAE